MHALRGFDGIGSTLPRANRGDILAALMDFSMPDPELFREELQRVLSSASFARAERMSRLLRFLVERHLEGKDDELKESIIAVEVFGRRPDVRSQARFNGTERRRFGSGRVSARTIPLKAAVIRSSSKCRRAAMFRGLAPVFPSIANQGGAGPGGLLSA